MFAHPEIKPKHPYLPGAILILVIALSIVTYRASSATSAYDASLVRWNAMAAYYQSHSPLAKSASSLSTLSSRPARSQPVSLTPKSGPPGR